MKDFSQPKILIENRTKAHKKNKLTGDVPQRELTPHSISGLSFLYLDTLKLTTENIHTEAIKSPAL